MVGPESTWPAGHNYVFLRRCTRGGLVLLAVYLNHALKNIWPMTLNAWQIEAMQMASH